MEPRAPPLESLNARDEQEIVYSVIRREKYYIKNSSMSIIRFWLFLFFFPSNLRSLPEIIWNKKRKSCDMVAEWHTEFFDFFEDIY